MFFAILLGFMTSSRAISRQSTVVSLVLLGGVTLSVFAAMGSAQMECVGLAINTPGCPPVELAPPVQLSEDDIPRPPHCGDATIQMEEGEECDTGFGRNGSGDCTAKCRQLFCGDGVVSPSIGESCEPQQYYAYGEYDQEIDENAIVLRFKEQPACGQICTVPDCGDDGCFGGCESQFLAACTQQTQVAAAQAVQRPQEQAAVQGNVVEYSPQCGNGQLDRGEECDDGNRNSADSCTILCLSSRCSDGFLQPWEECDDGNTFDADMCTNACKRPACGDGILQYGEQCDDGNRSSNDGCTADCTMPSCGDAILQYGEQCDDGNENNADLCTVACRLPGCGDGFTQSPELCDDGNGINDDGCSNACRPPTCGDGIVQYGEDCDDANAVNGDICSNSCRSPACGDGIVQQGEQCDDSNQMNTDACTNTCKLPSCGDGIVQQGEQCDDGNTSSADACTALCKFQSCGDGFIQRGEDCDDGNLIDTDGCTNGCHTVFCGDGIRQLAEECDDANAINDDMCTNECRKARCGDGIVQGKEECDGGTDCGSGCKIAVKVVLVSANGQQPPSAGSGLMRNAAPSTSVLSMINPQPLLVGLAGLTVVALFSLVIARIRKRKPAPAASGQDGHLLSIEDVPLDEIEMPWRSW